MTDPVRLARRVSELLGCTRAEAEAYIRNGWVRVADRVVEAPEHRITDEPVSVDADARLEPVEPATLLLNKPAGFDAIDGPRPAATLVVPASHWSDDPSGVRLLQRHFQRLTPLTPLEHDASGLMVFSQDDRIRRRLTEEADLIEHEYVVEVAGETGPYTLGRLKHGLTYRGRALPPCQVSWQSERRLRFALKGVRDGQLRHMCAQVGLEAVSIRRLRIGRVGTGKGPHGAMPPGAWRYLPAGATF